MGDLPVAPSIGDKRARGDDEDEAGNNVPPNLRGRTDNNGQSAITQGMSGPSTMQWQGAAQVMPGGMNLAANNAGLDALYLGELNWVGIDAYPGIVWLTRNIVDDRRRSTGC